MDAAQFVTHTRPLSKVNEAFAIAASGEALKVMVEPDGLPEAAALDRITAAYVEEQLASSGAHDGIP